MLRACGSSFSFEREWSKYPYCVLNGIVSVETIKMAEAFKGKHVVIFSSSCLFSSSEELQPQMNEEIVALSKNGNFGLHFTSHRNPTSKMLRSIPEG